MDFFFVKAIVALFIVVDPLGLVPLYITLTSGQERFQRRNTALRATIAAFIILFLFSIAGKSIFYFFGTSMGAFQVAGGILLFFIAMDMLRAHPTGLSQTVEEEVTESKSFEDVSIVPIAMPLLAGPSAIATVVVLVDEAAPDHRYWQVVVAMMLVLGVTYFVMRMCSFVMKVLGKTGLFLAMRLMGLMLAAVAVQFIVDGVYKLFPILATIGQGAG